MGGCSTKPKTAEYEGALEVQEEKPSTEAPRKSLEAETLGLKAISRNQELSAPSVRTLLTEEEQDDVGDMFAETHNKQMIAASSPEGKERQVLEDDTQHVKQILAETIDNLQAEKGSTLNEDILKLQINPEIVASELHEDTVSNMEATKTKLEAPVCFAFKAETAITQQGLLALPKEVLDDNGNYVFPECETPSLKDICINSVQNPSKVQVKPMGPQNGLPEVSENLSAGGKCVLDMQKLSFHVAPELQGDVSTYASDKGQGKEVLGLGCFELVSKNEKRRLDGSDSHKGWFSEESKDCGELCKKTENGAGEEQRLDGDVSHKGQGNQGRKECGDLCNETDGGACEEQRLDVSASLKGQEDNQFSDGSKDYIELCTETEGGVCEEVSAASNAVLAQDSEEDVLKDTSMSRCDDGIKGLASDEAVGKVPFPDTYQEPSRVNVSMDAVQPAITTNVRANNSQHAGDEVDSVQEDQKVNGGATFKMAMKDVKLQAEDHSMNGLKVKELKAGTLQTIHGDGELSSPNSSMNDKQSLPLSVQFLLESKLREVQTETPYAADGKAKADAPCAPDELTAFPVSMSTKKPEAQSAHVMHSAEPPLTSAQDTPTPDIDDVLEKLASEFERQESLARASS